MTAATSPTAAAMPARLAGHALLLLVFLLPFMQPAIPLFGFEAVAADAAYLLLAPLWALALATGSARLRWHPAYWLLGLYFAAMAMSAAVSPEPERSLLKLATQLYLLSLPVIACSLIRTEPDLKRVCYAWLGATAVVAAAAPAAVAAFLVDPDNAVLAWTRNEYGTLPPGPYPRLRLTFLYASMLCNYLTVSLMILLVARRLGWIANGPFLLLLSGLLFAAAFSITPGLGGIFLAGGLWTWLLLRDRQPTLARLALIAGGIAALLFVGAMTVTPFLYPTAPFLITIPGTDLTFAPAIRLLAWIDAASNFAADPLLGRGIGREVVAVRIQIPNGEMSGVTNAHNVFLNVAVQCGVVGLLALLALLGWVARRLRPVRLTEPVDVLRFGLAFVFLVAFAYEGLGGGFEDARHLWLLFGLILAADRLGSRANAERAAPAGTALPL